MPEERTDPRRIATAKAMVLSVSEDCTVLDAMAKKGEIPPRMVSLMALGLKARLGTIWTAIDLLETPE